MSEQKPITICLFTDTVCDANGVSRFIQDITKEADKRGYKFYVLTSTRKDKCEEHEKIINYRPNVRIPMPFYPELDLAMPAFYKFKKIVKELKPDLIHVATPGPVGFCGMIISHRLGVPRAGVYHTDFPSYIKDNTKSRFAENMTIKLMRRFYKNFDKVFARSHKYMEVLKNDIKLPQDKLHAIAPGINVEKFHRDYREPSMWSSYAGVIPDSIKALYVGRLTKEKNFPFLLDTWCAFQEQRKEGSRPVQLICIGEGQILEEKEKWLEKNVVLLGYKGGIELSKLYASCDFFLFPSLTDTLGQVVMEAQSSGMPVVVSDIGGPQTVINLGNRQSGFVVSTESQQGWIETIEKLSDDDALRQELGNNGFETIQNMSIENSFNDFWQINLEVALARQKAE